jgi:Dyp-type peroxidase family
MAKASRKTPRPAATRTRLRTITTFAPVPEHALAELTERLRALKDEPSPFASVPGTHFARLAVLGRDEFKPQPRPKGMRRSARILDLITHAGRAQRPDPPSLSYLLFSANYDGAEGATDDVEYLDRLRQQLTTAADHVWGLCSDYPGWSDRAGFLAFFAERSLPARYLFSASDAEPQVEQILSALRLRQQVTDLAMATQGRSDEELAKAFDETFGTQPLPGLHALPDPQAQPTGAQLPTRPAAEPALVDPPTGAELLAGPDQEAPTEPDLADVQNLVTSGYPRHEHARHLLLRITDPEPARRWLARVAEAIPTAGWADGYVDRLEYEALDRVDTAPEGRAGAPGFAVHVALSYAGLARLGLPESELAGFSSEFRAGMASREAGLAPGRGTEPWRPPFAPIAEPAAESAVDVLVMFSAADANSLDDEFADRPALLPGPDDGLHLLQQITAGRIREDRYGPGDGVGKPGFLEHFGFVDGISQPRIHGVTAGRRVAELPAGEVLLGYRDVDGDTAGAGLPAALARNGSYLVYRKLEQDVPAFRELTRELGGQLADRVKPGTDPEQLAAAKLMGRWRNGTPLTTSPDRKDAAVPAGHFGFQEGDAEGYGCPVGAHIRRANPRDSRPVDPNLKADTGGDAGLEATLTLRHRMLRRGIPYGTPLGDEAENEQADTEERGLLFLALVGDLRRQFEFVQAHWMSDGNAFRLGTDRDVLSGATEAGNKFVVQGAPPVFAKPTTPLVTCRGGEYFFLPGIAALKRIAAQPAESRQRQMQSTS